MCPDLFFLGGLSRKGFPPYFWETTCDRNERFLGNQQLRFSQYLLPKWHSIYNFNIIVKIRHNYWRWYGKSLLHQTLRGSRPFNNVFTELLAHHPMLLPIFEHGKRKAIVRFQSILESYYNFPWFNMQIFPWFPCKY
jgi:hypothetical protein